jgi:DNA-binding transcriptional LysR family regulator
VIPPDRKSHSHTLAAPPIASVRSPGADSAPIDTKDAALRRERPRVKIEIEATAFLELISLIKQQIVDVGFGYGPTLEHGVAVEALFLTRIVCFVPEHHELANRKVLRPKDLEGSTVIALRPTTPIGILLHEVLQKQKVRNINLLRTNSGSTAVGLAVHGVGIALTDVMAFYAGGARGVRIVPFEPMISLTLAAIYSRHRPVSRGLARFIAQVRTTLHEIWTICLLPDCRAKSSDLFRAVRGTAAFGPRGKSRVRYFGAECG